LIEALELDYCIQNYGPLFLLKHYNWIIVLKTMDHLSATLC